MTVQVNILKGNATIVDSLGSSLRRGTNALEATPALLGRICLSDCKGPPDHVEISGEYGEERCPDRQR